MADQTKHYHALACHALETNAEFLALPEPERFRAIDRLAIVIEGFVKSYLANPDWVIGIHARPPLSELLDVNQ